MDKPGEIVCWRCGASLAEMSLPLLRVDECPSCRAELHVCKMCEFFDLTVADSCREPVAAEVRDKERANFCDYFRLTPDAYLAVSAEQTNAEQQLSNLFGDDKKGDPDVDSQNELDDLFKKS